MFLAWQQQLAVMSLSCAGCFPCIIQSSESYWFSFIDQGDLCLNRKQTMSHVTHLYCGGTNIESISLTSYLYYKRLPVSLFHMFHFILPSFVTVSHACSLACIMASLKVISLPHTASSALPLVPSNVLHMIALQ